MNPAADSPNQICEADRHLQQPGVSLAGLSVPVANLIGPGGEKTRVDHWAIADEALVRQGERERNRLNPGDRVHRAARGRAQLPHPAESIRDLGKCEPV